MRIESPSFSNMEKIPPLYTCEGKDVSPPLEILDIPKNTQTLAIVVDDPDAPTGTFDHWIVWNLPPKGSIKEGAAVPFKGRNHFGETRYRGPCPPRGKVHRYHFKAYALDTKLNLTEGSTKTELETAMQGHILAQATLIGTYKR